MELYSVYDKKMGVYGRPMPTEHLVQVLRGLKQVVNSNEKAPLSMYPEDFDLYKVGEFDEKTGEIHRADLKPIFMQNLAELKEKTDVTQLGLFSQEEKANE